MIILFVSIEIIIRPLDIVYLTVMMSSSVSLPAGSSHNQIVIICEDYSGNFMLPQYENDQRRSTTTKNLFKFVRRERVDNIGVSDERRNK